MVMMLPVKFVAFSGSARSVLSISLGISRLRRNPRYLTLYVWWLCRSHTEAAPSELPRSRDIFT